MKKQIILLLAGLCLVGCGNQQDTIKESETIIGYIHIKDNLLMVDEVEIVKRDNTEKIEELQLIEASDFPSGYYIYNELKEINSYILTDETKYTFTDFEQLYVDKEAQDKLYETKILNEFIEASSYQNMELEELELDENYIPYFIEVLDGEVIGIFEDFTYTM